MKGEVILRFKWADGSRVPINAQVAGEELARITEKEGGHLTPEAVLREARSPFSPLHPAFEWDDSRAAEGYRRVQANYLIRSLMVIPIKAEGVELEPVRAYASVSLYSDVDEPVSKTVYVTMGQALSVEDLRRQVLERAMREFNGWKRRYKQYEELAAIFAAAEGVMMQLALAEAQPV